MKRAMGLVFAVFAFAVVAHADRISYGGAEYAGRTGEDYRFLAPSTDTLQSSYLVNEPSTIALGRGDSFSAPDDPERFINEVFYSDLAYSAKTAENSVEFDFVRRYLDGFDGRGEHLGIVHTDPFRRAFAVEEVPEPATLLLMGVGFIALAIWKRRSALYADNSERAC
jgi:PEP-CTERM motif-containing protein